MLGGLADDPHADALVLAVGQLDDGAVRAEAAAAVVKIASALPLAESGAVRPALQKVQAAVTAGPLAAQARKLLTAIDESEGKRTRLFDGKTFEGWEGNLDWFRIEDGAIVGGTLERKIPRNEFLCTTREYANFEHRLKAKLIDNKGNAGIQIRSQRIPNHHEMIGYQADIAKGIWGSLYDESRRREFLAQPDAKTLAEVLTRISHKQEVRPCRAATGRRRFSVRPLRLPLCARAPRREGDQKNCRPV